METKVNVVHQLGCFWPAFTDIPGRCAEKTSFEAGTTVGQFCDRLIADKQYSTNEIGAVLIPSKIQSWTSSTTLSDETWKDKVLGTLGDVDGIIEFIVPKPDTPLEEAILP